MKTMEFINQVKKLKEQTKSPAVRQLCESYLSGSSKVSKETIAEALNEHESQNEPFSKTQNYREAIKAEELQTAKKLADSLMESWGGLGGSKASTNSGSYQAKDEKKENGSLMESLSNLSVNDESLNSFMDAQQLKNLGVMESIAKIKGSSIYEYPAVKVICEKYSNLIQVKRIPEFALAHNFIAEASSFNWDNTVKSLVESLHKKIQENSREIEVSKVLESIKSSGSHSFYSELSDTLNTWLVSESKSSGVLAKSISKYSFNPVVRNLINFLNVNEASDTRKLEIPFKSQGESSVSRIFSPVLVEEGRTVIAIGKDLFEATGEEFSRMSKNEVNGVSQDFLALVSAVNSKGVKVNENGIFIQLGKKSVRLIEEGNDISVYLDKSKLTFRTLGELAKMLNLEGGAYFGMNESQAIGNVITLYKGYNDVVELDFAKSIVSNIYEGASVNLIKWGGKIYLQRINEGMRENSIFKVNGSQAVKMVKDFLRYDISEGLTDFLDGENKVKSIMINDRTKVLENITRVESEISKVEGLMENNPLYAESKQMKAAHSILNNELTVLKEKWNQINLELERIEINTSALDSDLLEDEKFNIGSYIKVKESGETGKIISMDGSSGRYTVLLDNGRTSEFLVNEIQDIEEALSQAAERNEESSDEDGEEEVKEANNFNKSQLSEEEQKKILKTLADNHSFSKAPKGVHDKIEMEMDSVHGYNVSMNEGSKKEGALSKAPGDSKIGSGKDGNKGNLAKAPGNDKMEKSKVEGEDLLDDKAPETKKKTEFDSQDAEGKKYDIGYNLREGEKNTLADAPESGKQAPETKRTTDTNLVEAPEKGTNAKETSATATIAKKQNLAQAPGKEGDIDYEANKKSGYNLSESDEVKKK